MAATASISTRKSPRKDPHGGACREGCFDELRVDGIEPGKVRAWVVQVHRGLDDMGEVQTVPGQDGGQILHRLHGLFFNAGEHEARLHVHNNTVRYRVGRLVKDFDLDLDDPQKRLWLWLRLTAMDLAPKARSTVPG